MTTEEKILIAEFMGIEYGEDGYYVPWLPEHQWYDSKYGRMFTRDYRTLQFHTSWDWLMPVVEKIESLDECDEFRIERDQTIAKGWRILEEGYQDKICWIEYKKDNTKVEMVYKAVVAFIHWYNQQPK